MSEGTPPSRTETATVTSGDRSNEDLLIGIERQKEYNRLVAEQLRNAFKLNDAYKAQLDLETNILAQMKARLDTVKATDPLGALQEIKDFFDDDAKDLSYAYQAGFERIVANAKEIIAGDLFGTLTFDVKDYMKEQLDKLRADLQDVQQFSDAVESRFSSMGAALGVSMDVGNSAIGRTLGLLGKFSSGNIALKGVAILQNTLQFAAGSMVSLMQKSIDLAFELDNAGKKFQQSTGFIKDFSGEITQVFANTRMAGVSIDEASKSLGDLSSGLSVFNPNAEAMNERLATSISLMEKIGIASSEAVKNMEVFTRSLGMTADMANHQVLQLATMGERIGIETKKMMSDLSATLPNLVQFGSKTNQIFTDLAAQSKASGLEMSKLVSIAERFETFDDAADNTAKLNAMLGTNLSAMEMLTANYDDKLHILRKSLQSAVTDLSQMDRFTQKFVKEALGVGSVAEAQALLNMSNSEYLSYRSDMEAQAKTQAELQKQVEELVPVMDRLKLAFTSLAIALVPAATAFIEIVTFITDLVLGFQELVKSGPGVLVFSTAVAGLAFSFRLLGGVIGKLIAPTGGITLLVIGLHLLADQRPMMKLLGVALIGLGASLYFVGGAANFLNARLGLIVFAFTTIAAIMAYRINPLFIHAFGFMAGQLYAFGFAAQVTGKQILMIGVAFALMGAGLAMAIYAFKELLSVAMQFFQVALDNNEKLYEVAGGITAIAFAVNFLSISLLSGLAVAVIYFATMGLLLGAILSSGVFGGKMSFNLDDLTTFASAMTMIGAGMTEFVKGLTQIATVTSQVKASIGNGLFAATVEGGKTSVVMAGEGTLKAISASKIEVDVKIPEIKVPQPIVNVYVDGKKISAEIKEGIVA